jgi:hypothetical protein
MIEDYHILMALEESDLHAAEWLLPNVHDEVCTLAASKLALEKPGPV